MKSITIITFFFQLDRGKWDSFKRSDDQYFEYFDKWARLQNDLIVYTQDAYKDRILNIRKKYGRKNTKVIVIEDVFKLEEELYRNIENVAKNRLSIDFRLTMDNPESWNAEYNYVMLLKAWCVKNAVENHYASGMIAWMDFGFNHGDSYYQYPEEMDFLWEFDFSYKVHALLVNDIDNLPVFEIVRRMNTYIQGCLIVAPDQLWIELWDLLKNNMMALTKIGLMDDDQTILVMAYREKPEIFELEYGTWFSQFEKWSYKNFTVKNEVALLSQTESESMMVCHRKIVNQYLEKWRDILNNGIIKS